MRTSKQRKELDRIEAEIRGMRRQLEEWRSDLSKQLAHTMSQKLLLEAGFHEMVEAKKKCESLGDEIKRMELKIQRRQDKVNNY